MSKSDEYDVAPAFRSLVMDRLWKVSDRFVGVERDAVYECIGAVRELMQDES